ncbi:uncharacterized protein LOC134527824 [Bacillus rossius redtenbacheri]|uniref:uncharacterized protein LOC134527824 n=1 Tax=Bacillus rossius redtenbacheri TaxID=93214 RepID=UPI002FDE74B1
MSLHSTADLGEIFRSMFPDSGIASKFSMGETKCSYVINHGLAPYFDQLLKERLSECKDYVVSFDESINKIVQRGQMDLFVRYFDVNRNKVCTQYYNSVFLGNASAENLLHSFTSGIQPMSLNKILSISMDGPNVNLSFLKKLDEKIREESEPDGKILVNTGVCGLYVVNGAIRTGLNSVGWDVPTFLRDIYFIFNESPARRADFTSVTGRKEFPRKYCTTRWLENVPFLERALLLFDDVKKFIENTKAVKTKTLLNVRDQSKDKFMKCKLSFFKSLSNDCEPFLKKYQTASPLAPYLSSDLKNLIETLMQRFVKSNKMPATVKKLLAVDLHCAENLRELKNIDLGFQTKKLLREVVSTDREVLEFKKDCQKILTRMTEKIRERSPLKYPVVQGLSSLDPKIIHKQPEQGKIRFDILLDVLYSHNRITETVAQRAKTQYSGICDAQCGLQKKFCEFLEENNVESSQCLDEFYSSILLEYQELWEVVKLCLIFSHGNATVESGFSINKSLLVENLQEESVIAQRKVYDGIKYYETIHKVPLTQKMLSYVRNSRRRYSEHLDNAKRNKKEEGGTIQKRQLQNEIKKLEKRRKILRLEKQHEEETISAQINLLHKKILD